MCQKCKWQIACFGFLSSVVSTVCGCSTNEKDHALYDLCDSCVYSREIINMFSVSQVSRLVKNCNIEIFSDTINVISVKLCMMILLVELYLLIPFNVLDLISRLQHCRAVLSEHFLFISD